MPRLAHASSTGGLNSRAFSEQSSLLLRPLVLLACVRRGNSDPKQMLVRVCHTLSLSWGICHTSAALNAHHHPLLDRLSSRSRRRTPLRRLAASRRRRRRLRRSAATSRRRRRRRRRLRGCPPPFLAPRTRRTRRTGRRRRRTGPTGQSSSFGCGDNLDIPTNVGTARATPNCLRH